MSWQADRNDVPPCVREQILLLPQARTLGDDREAHKADSAFHSETTNFGPDRAAWIAFSGMEFNCLERSGIHANVTAGGPCRL